MPQKGCVLPLSSRILRSPGSPLQAVLSPGSSFALCKADSLQRSKSIPPDRHHFFQQLKPAITATEQGHALILPLGRTGGDLTGCAPGSSHCPGEDLPQGCGSDTNKDNQAFYWPDSPKLSFTRIHRIGHQRTELLSECTWSHSTSCRHRPIPGSSWEAESVPTPVPCPGKPHCGVPGSGSLGSSSARHHLNKIYREFPKRHQRSLGTLF